MRKYLKKKLFPPLDLNPRPSTNFVDMCDTLQGERGEGKGTRLR